MAISCDNDIAQLVLGGEVRIEFRGGVKFRLYWRYLATQCAFVYVYREWLKIL